MNTTNPTNWILIDMIQVFTNNMDFDEKKKVWLCVFLSAETGSYVCEFCGKQYKYFNPYQEHVALHTPMGEPVKLMLTALIYKNWKCPTFKIQSPYFS